MRSSLAGTSRASQRQPSPRQQFAAARFGQVIVGTGIQAASPIGGPGFGTEHVRSRSSPFGQAACRSFSRVRVGRVGGVKSRHLRYTLRESHAVSLRSEKT
jgi:hypothetical protein